MNHLSTIITGKIGRLLGEQPCRMQVAALPWRKGKNGMEVMLITSRDTGRWLLPKGWPEAGEELYESAAREAHEEAGIEGVVSAVEAGRYFYSKATAGVGVRCEVLVFPLEVRGTAGKWKEKGERKRKWMSPARAAKIVSEPAVAELILNFAAEQDRAA